MLDGLSNALISFAIQVISLFPESPIQIGLAYLNNSVVSTILSYVNYIIPIGDMLTILSLWLSAVLCYYVYQIVLRWIRVVE